jgi:hypothetical protein
MNDWNCLRRQLRNRTPGRLKAKGYNSGRFSLHRDLSFLMKP